MCGIVGGLSSHEIAPVLLQALGRLEYRGYDSAGIATVDRGCLDRRRAAGRLANLSDLLVRSPLQGKAGIGHTRWATHGAPNVVNAHPHCAGRVAVVHNGIIENFHDLREELLALGVGFESDTDTETVAHLVQLHLDRGMDPLAATEAALDRLQGAFALLFLFEGEDNLLIAARRGSPLAIGWGEDGVFVGSDAIALASLASRISYLEEGDRAFITRTESRFLDAEGRTVTRLPRQVGLDPARIEKGGYRHFMAKEIAEQPSVIAELLDHYTTSGREEIVFSGATPAFSNITRVVMVGCGTAFYACVVAKYWMEQIAGLPVEVDIASEFRYREPPLDADTLAIFVSQSGETADTLAALRYCKGRVGAVLSVVNVPESTIARESDLVLPILAGPEIGVASTKAFTCQLAVLAICALEAARQRGAISGSVLSDHLAALAQLPAAMREVLGLENRLAEIAQSLAKASDALFLGRGTMFPMALEGALKLKEISYIHAEGYASGELKHGPIALVDQTLPVIVLAPGGGVFDKVVSNMQEVLARGGRVVLVTDAAGAARAGTGEWDLLVLPDIPDLVAPVLYAVPLQLLAYHAALAKGTDVDQPRNLAKAVTVE